MKKLFCRIFGHQRCCTKMYRTYIDDKKNIRHYVVEQSYCNFCGEFLGEHELYTLGVEKHN